MFKVRFNLGKGPRYQTWKITHPDGKVEYIGPNDVYLIFIKAKLRNQKGSAEKIYDGANKRVCAWIECEDLKIKYKYRFGDNLNEISYNPRVAPYWRNIKNEDIDNSTFNTLRSLGNRIFQIIK